MNIDFSSLSGSQAYFAMVQSIIPRPIAWVLSDSGNDRLNLAPYSFFTGVCSEPPLLMISAGKKAEGKESGSPKDTRINIAERDYFVVHIASSTSLDTLNASAETLDHQDSEIEKLGLDTCPFDQFPLPRLSVASIAFGCKRYRIDEIGNTPQAVIYGEILTMYVNENVVDKHDSRLIINPKKLDPLARLGGAHYAELGTLLSAKRPK